MPGNRRFWQTVKSKSVILSDFSRSSKSSCSETAGCITFIKVSFGRFFCRRAFIVVVGSFTLCFINLIGRKCQKVHFMINFHIQPIGTILFIMSLFDNFLAQKTISHYNKSYFDAWMGNLVRWKSQKLQIVLISLDDKLSQKNRVEFFH